jgi:hypothetical protein
MGVGGTYDVFTGHVHRAPKFWQDLGLEWFYRLLLQPSRIKRQFACCAIYVGIIPVSSDIPLQTGEFAYIFCVILHSPDTLFAISENSLTIRMLNARRAACAVVQARHFLSFINKNNRYMGKTIRGSRHGKQRHERCATRYQARSRTRNKTGSRANTRGYMTEKKRNSSADWRPDILS